MDTLQYYFDYLNGQSEWLSKLLLFKHYLPGLKGRSDLPITNSFWRKLNSALRFTGRSWAACCCLWFNSLTNICNAWRWLLFCDSLWQTETRRILYWQGNCDKHGLAYNQRSTLQYDRECRFSDNSLWSYRTNAFSKAYPYCEWSWRVSDWRRK